MKKYSRLEVHQTLCDSGLMPLFYHPDPEVAFQIAAACHRGGAKVIEFTNRGDFAHEVFGTLIKRIRRELPELLVGIGSLQDAGTTALYIQMGVDFVVTPILREDVILTCNRRKVAVIPGVATPSEIGRAEELGVELIKLSPGDVLGPAFLKAHLAPCPWTKALISGGVSPDEANLKAWFGAGAACVAMGSKLITAEVLANKDYDLLENNVKNVVKMIKKLKKH
jgi:2-dehydro-3-deoxyphosphogluconate aldolase / (4S)-4-hydroxy-2-oxoglutarate aldolase